MPLPSTINLEISIPIPDRKISLYTIAACKNIIDKIYFFVNVKINTAGALLGDALV